VHLLDYCYDSLLPKIALEIRKFGQLLLGSQGTRSVSHIIESSLLSPTISTCGAFDELYICLLKLSPSHH
jgi:hypothetical protein